MILAALTKVLKCEVGTGTGSVLNSADDEIHLHFSDGFSGGILHTGLESWIRFLDCFHTRHFCVC